MSLNSATFDPFLNSLDSEANDIEQPMASSFSKAIPTSLSKNNYFNFPQICGYRLTKLLVIAGIFALLFVLIGFVILVASVVRCDEKYLIAQYDQRRESIENTIARLGERMQQETIKKEEDYKSQKIQWVPGSQFNENIMEPAGNELSLNKNILLYVARADHLNGMVVGRYCPQYREMYIGYQGREYVKSQFELLTFPKGSLSWIPANISTISQVPVGDLVFGASAPGSDESTYICRGQNDSHLLVGKFLFSEGKCLCTYGKPEIPFWDFEILTVNKMGKLIGVNA